MKKIPAEGSKRLIFNASLMGMVAGLFSFLLSMGGSSNTTGVMIGSLVGSLAGGLLGGFLVGVFLAKRQERKSAVSDENKPE